MADKRLTFTSWFLLVLAAAFFGVIGVLIDWGGRIEATLMVYGEPVFIDLDAGRLRTVLLLTLPVALVAAAFATRKQREPK
jgi:hypothetical protein